MKTKFRSLLAVWLLGLALQAGMAAADDTPAPEFRMLIEVPSPLGFEETLERLEANARELGWKVPQSWKVDFQQNLLRVTETDIGPNRVLKMCEPFAAVKLLQKDEYKMLTAMMPCTLAVYQKSDGKTYVAMMNLEAMGQMYGGDVLEMSRELAPQMEQMIRFD